MFLELNHLSKSFGGKNVVRDLSLGLDQGELLYALLIEPFATLKEKEEGAP